MKSSSKKLGCSCPKCQECCKREPGWFLPEEVDVAARFYIKKGDVSHSIGDIPPKVVCPRLRWTRPLFSSDIRADFVAQYCKEHEEDGVLAISPATKPGTTECIFLGSNGLCKIHPVKPYECRKVYGCEGAAKHRRIREIIKRRWK